MRQQKCVFGYNLRKLRGLSRERNSICKEDQEGIETPYQWVLHNLGKLQTNNFTWDVLIFKGPGESEFLQRKLLPNPNSLSQGVMKANGPNEKIPRMELAFLVSAQTFLLHT